MWALTTGCQIEHAARADAHLQVSKQTGDGLPTSQVAPLVGEARTREIARMLGGEQLSDTTLAHAREMLALPAQPPGAAARPRKVRA